MSSIGQSILMALTVTVNKFASSNVQAVHRRQRKDRRKTTSSKAANDFGRRGLLLSAAFATPPVSESGAELLKSTAHIIIFLGFFFLQLKFIVLFLLVYGLPMCFFFLLGFSFFSFLGLYDLVVIEICIRVSEEVRREQGQE